MEDVDDADDEVDVDVDDDKDDDLDDMAETRFVAEVEVELGFVGVVVPVKLSIDACRCGWIAAESTPLPLL